MFIGVLSLFVNTQQYLARRGILAPEYVSLFSHDPPLFLDWSEAEISHLHYESHGWSNEIVRWASHVESGKVDRRQRVTMAEFIEGGTIGPVPDR